MSMCGNGLSSKPTDVHYRRAYRIMAEVTIGTIRANIRPRSSGLRMREAAMAGPTQGSESSLLLRTVGSAGILVTE